MATMPRVKINIIGIPDDFIFVFDSGIFKIAFSVGKKKMEKFSYTRTTSCMIMVL